MPYFMRSFSTAQQRFTYFSSYQVYCVVCMLLTLNVSSSPLLYQAPFHCNAAVNFEILSYKSPNIVTPQHGLSLLLLYLSKEATTETKTVARRCIIR